MLAGSPRAIPLETKSVGAIGGGKKCGKAAERPREDPSPARGVSPRPLFEASVFRFAVREPLPPRRRLSRLAPIVVELNHPSQRVGQVTFFRRRDLSLALLQALVPLHEHGLGLPKDYTEAMNWYRRAADQGNANGQLGVGTMYLSGQGVQKNETEASKWFRKAADHGNAKAQNNRGAMYAMGKGVERDVVQAYVWFELAASNSSPIETVRAAASRSRDYLADRMSPTQIAEALKRASEWNSK